MIYKRIYVSLIILNQINLCVSYIERSLYLIDFTGIDTDKEGN